MGCILLFLGCSSEAETSSSSGGSSSNSDSGSSSSSGGGGLAQPKPQPPPVAFGWQNRTTEAGLDGISSDCAAVSFADLDGDGAPDLVVSHQGLEVYRNDGAGHFTAWAKVPLAADDAAAMTHVCPQAIEDLDGDGRLDVVIGLNGGTRVALFFNEGNGVFTPALFGALDPGTPDVSPYAIGVLAGGDSDPLIIVGRDLESAVKGVDFQTCSYDARGVNVECQAVIPATSSLVYRLDRKARSLAVATDAALGHAGNALAFGILDADQDGRQDLIVGMDFLPQRAFRRGDAKGFTEPPDGWGLSVYAHGMGVALGDWDGDGRDDAVIATLGGVLDFAGVASGGFAFRGDASELMTRKRAIWPWSVLLADLDNDGKLDLFVSNQFASDKDADPVKWMGMIGGPADFVGAYDTVFLQRPDGLVAEGRVSYDAILPGHAKGRSAAIADIDGDGRLEVAMLLRRASGGGSSDLALGSLQVSTGHGLTVRFPGAGARPGLTAEIVCAGAKQTRTLYGAEGHAAAAQKDLHFGCGAATTYDSLTVHVPGTATPIVLSGGALDTAVTVQIP